MSITAPLGALNLKPGTTSLGALNLKPGTTPLAPSRAPAAIAIVGGSSLRIHSPDRPMAVPSAPAAAASSRPATHPKSFLPSAAPSSRPSTQPQGFAPPAGGPPASYERAFRQWSSPNVAPADDPSSPANAAGAVTFQVYTAQDIGTGRAPVRSLPGVAAPAKKPSVAALVGMSVVGVIVVLLTAAAVIAVSTEDPKRPVPSATASPSPSAAAMPEPPPSTISIGDPLPNALPNALPDTPIDPPVDDLPATPTPTAGVIAAPTAKAPRPKPANTTPAAPASLKGIAPPPNPYGK